MSIKLVVLLVLWFPWQILSVAAAGLADSSSDLYVLGVYEGHTHKYGKVTVFVAPQENPVVLLLTAYESVNWQIELEPGARVTSVILSGYHEQMVSGLPAHIPVQSSSYDQKSSSYLYGHDNGSCFNLVAKIQQLYGQRARQSLCQYRGIAFVVEQNGIRPLPLR
jgi:hypothetical protein